MHLYTVEPPITSFFPRITTYKKRKIHTELASDSSNKRQRDHISTTFKQGKAKEDGQERRNTLDNEVMSISRLPSEFVDDPSAIRPAQTSERHMSLLPSLNTIPQTPKPDQLPSRNRHNTSFQTPPPTNEGAKRQRLMELTPTLCPIISWKSPDLSTGKDLLPTPSTLGGSASRHSRHSGNDRCRIVPRQDLLLPTQLKYSETSLDTSLSVSIPSSQSQLMANTYFEDDSTPASTVLPCKWQLPQHGVQSSAPNRTSLDRIDKEETFYTTQTFISSSQSQFLSPLEYQHPQRSQPSSVVSNSELEIIPSSQSQENELRILSDLEVCHQSMHSRKQALPQRTLSDELFSVPILQNGWPDCNLDSKQLSQGTTPRVTNDNDSATESETEPETEGKDSYRNHCLAPLQSQLSKPSTADLASLNEDSQHKDSCDSQQSSQDLSLADQTSSFASLPTAVKEFRRMFGPDDGSYPPDFPMSLR